MAGESRMRYSKRMIRRLSLAAAVITVTLQVAGCRHAHEPTTTPDFSDEPHAAGIARETRTYDAAVGDFDGDGWPDLYVGNHGAGAVLLRNRGDRRFDDV